MPIAQSSSSDWVGAVPGFSSSCDFVPLKCRIFLLQRITWESESRERDLCLIKGKSEVSGKKKASIGRPFDPCCLIDKCSSFSFHLLPSFLPSFNHTLPKSNSISPSIANEVTLVFVPRCLLLPRFRGVSLCYRCSPLFSIDCLPAGILRRSSHERKINAT